MASEVKIDETDEWGFTLLRRTGNIQLFQIPKGYCSVYLWVNEEEYLTAVRKEQDNAERLFDSTSGVLSAG